MWLNFVKTSRVERHRLVMNVDPCSFKLQNFVIFCKFFHRSSFVVFDPHSASCETSESDRMVRFANHVLHVAMHSNSRIQLHRYGSPGSVWKAISQKTIDRDACFFHRGSFGHAHGIASKSETRQGTVPLTGLCVLQQIFGAVACTTMARSRFALSDAATI